jgi:hypothetical protein
MPNERENKNKALSGSIRLFIIFLILSISFILVVLFFIDISWGFKALIFGIFLIFIGISLIFFKIILMQKYDLTNPGGGELQKTILLLNVSGLIIIFISLLNMIEVIPWF